MSTTEAGVWFTVPVSSGASAKRGPLESHRLLSSWLKPVHDETPQIEEELMAILQRSALQGGWTRFPNFHTFFGYTQPFDALERDGQVQALESRVAELEAKLDRNDTEKAMADALTRTLALTVANMGERTFIEEKPDGPTTVVLRFDFDADRETAIHESKLQLFDKTRVMPDLEIIHRKPGFVIPNDWTPVERASSDAARG